MLKNNKKEEKREISAKNYVIVVIIFAVSIAIVFFLRNWYQNYQSYQKTIPILSGVLSEVRYNEIDNYISDNPTALIYIGVANDEDCRALEEDLKDLIKEKHLKDKIVYFNITDVEDKNLVLKEFSDKYATGDNIYSYPAIVLLDDGKILDFKSKNAQNNLSIGDVEQLFEEYEVYGD